MTESHSSLGNTTKLTSRSDFKGKYGSTALRFYLLEVARQLLPNERINVCWRYPLPARKTVEIIYSEERQCARSHGTMKCGSGWVCPACMSYISQRRREELEIAMKRKQDDWFTVMATYTAKHTSADRLAPLLGSMVKAYSSVFSGRNNKFMREEYMLTGSVRATEITHGSNGWHPHFHVLYFVDRAMLDDSIAGSPDEYCQSLKNHLGARWLAQLEKQGLTGSTGIALDIRSADDEIAAYISKFGKMPQDWTLNASAYEVASSVTKNAKNGSFGVLDILYASREDAKYEQLFREYHSATKGRSQLQWSRGLKAKLDFEVIRDEIAAQGIETETDRLMAEIGIDLWKYISRAGYMGQLMTYANAGQDEKTRVLIDKASERLERETWTIPQFDLGH